MTTSRTPESPLDPFPLSLERALRWAAVQHRGQLRKSSDVPYFGHVVGVAMILDRLGYPEPVVIAGLLHDVVEDTDATLEQVRDRFGAEVAQLVGHCSEVKRDEQGRKRPWIDRKRDHLTALEAAPVEARAVALADKLHNLKSIELDLREGRDVWANFNAGRGQVLWYYQAAIDRLGTGDDRLQDLADRCRETLKTINALSTGDPPPT